ncbi:hypothetical protein D4R86_05830 [bacterium]|nr:MAG: hypothetical protein D4R86_05830 [bacterium]
MKYLLKQNGYIAIVGVVLLGAGILIALISLSFGATTGTKIIWQRVATEKSSFLAIACAEEALEKIWQDLEYQGNEILTFDEGLCGILPVENGVGGEKTIKTYGSISGATRRLKIIIATTTPQIEISQWEEVAEF